MVELLKGPFLVLHFSYYTFMTFLMMLSLLLLSIDADDTTLYSKRNQAPDLWQQLDIITELESDQ